MMVSRFGPRLLAVPLLMINLINVTLLYRRYRTELSSNNSKWLGRDYPLAYEATLEPVLMTFDSSPHYLVAQNTTESDFAFLSLLPSSGGSLHLGPKTRSFDLSVFHELHCIWALNLALSGDQSSRLGHDMHCVDYLRNMAMCHPDLTLEPVRSENEDWMNWNTEDATHKCRDWTKLYEIEREDWQRWKSANSHA